MVDVNFARRRYPVFGSEYKNLFRTREAFFMPLFIFLIIYFSFAGEIKEPNVAGAFYPENKTELARTIDQLLSENKPGFTEDDVLAIILPHAGYGYSGGVTAYGLNTIKANDYKTIIIIAPSHYYSFSGISIYPEGMFRTSLGDIQIDEDLAYGLISGNSDIISEPRAFKKEHSIEVELPFLQRAFRDFKIVPVLMGDCTLSVCKNFAKSLKDIISANKNILIVISSDMYHGYDFEEAEKTDNLTLSYLKNFDYEGLYYGLREGKLSLCGGFPVVTSLILAKELGYDKFKVLKYTNSALVTDKRIKGIWTVGYSSGIIYREKGAKGMLKKEEKKRLLVIARKSIEFYLKNNKKMEVVEENPVFNQKMGAFVTLKKRNGQLRGCIGNLIGTSPLYMTVRDMAIEAATRDPRFIPLSLNELRDIEIEISVLSPLRKIESLGEINIGEHGVLIKKGFHSGVFLPQVAQETGWSKEEFLSNLCSEKAGLPSDAWKDKGTEIYIFSAEVFSEEELNNE